MMTSDQINDIRTVLDAMVAGRKRCYRDDCNCSVCPGRDADPELGELDKHLEQLWLDAIHHESRRAT